MPNITTESDQNLARRLLEVMVSLSGQRNVPRLYREIIEAAQVLTNADGGSLYIVSQTNDEAALRFEMVSNTSLGILMGADTDCPVDFDVVSLYFPDGRPNHSHVCAHTYHCRAPVNLPDVYVADSFDFLGTKTFDQKTGYRSKSMYTVPLIDHDGDVIGVLQLLNATDPLTGEIVPFDRRLESIIGALASSAAITLNNQILLQGHKDLLDAFIKVIAQAIDAKSAHTSGHCQRVPVLTKLLAQAACNTLTGPLSDFYLNEDDWYELHVAAWLHDCGKLATPDTLLDKATKLQTLADRIETVKVRFAALIAQKNLMVFEISDPDQRAMIEAECKLLREEFEFLVEVNKGGEFMRTQDQQRVREIAQRVWVDLDGVEQNLLTPDEVEMLCIAKGTLSEDERERINSHIAVTIEMLEALPFPKTLQRVPEYAGGHHERVDGTGYPKGLRGDQMSWPARMMAIADVFEALTAQDRPYKPIMKLSQALSILKSMAQSGHIDPDLYQIFIDQGVWRDYAHQYLLPEQLDIKQATEFRLP